MTRYAFVHLEYGNDHRELSMEVLRKLRTALAGDDGQVPLVIVDNAKSGSDEAYDGAGFVDGVVIAGDNSSREFSGWDRGVSRFLSRAEEPDIWIFTNDTIARHHGWSDDRAARFGAEIRRTQGFLAPWILGEINDFPQPMTTPLGAYMECVATYCFAMNGVLRTELGTLSPGNQLLDSLVHDDFEPAHQVFREHVDPQFVDFISSWMIKDQEDPDKMKRHKWAHEWQNVSPLNAQTFGNLRAKGRCYMAEAMLTVRARKVGADIRSPYDARNARDRVRKTLHFLADKVAEKRLLRKLQGSRAG